jgi:hypothetical protein
MSIVKITGAEVTLACFVIFGVSHRRAKVDHTTSGVLRPQSYGI